jgi:hypothetical protein
MIEAAESAEETYKCPDMRRDECFRWIFASFLGHVKV